MPGLLFGLKKDTTAPAAIAYGAHMPINVVCSMYQSFIV